MEANLEVQALNLLTISKQFMELHQLVIMGSLEIYIQFLYILHPGLMFMEWHKFKMISAVP